MQPTDRKDNCPKCLTGTMVPDDGDALCLNCGNREKSFEPIQMKKLVRPERIRLQDKHTLVARDQEILRRNKLGESTQAIADFFRLSKTRISQICQQEKVGGKNY